MPLLSITVKGTELALDEVAIKLDRGYEFTELKLLHIYHNIDSKNITGITGDQGKTSTQQALLFVRLGGLVEGHKQIVNYEGKYKSPTFHYQQNIYNDDDYQIGNGTINEDNAKTQSQVAVSDRYHADVNIFHLIPIGASRYNTHEIISRDVFRTLHKKGILKFNGELKFQLHYMNFDGDILPINTASGGIDVDIKGAVKCKSFITMLFEYEEA